MFDRIDGFAREALAAHDLTAAAEATEFPAAAATALADIEPAHLFLLHGLGVRTPVAEVNVAVLAGGILSGEDPARAGRMLDTVAGHARDWRARGPFTRDL